MVFSSGEESSGSGCESRSSLTTYRQRRLRRRHHVHHHVHLVRRTSTTSSEKMSVDLNWPFWWLGAAAIAVFVAPSISTMTSSIMTSSSSSSCDLSPSSWLRSPMMEKLMRTHDFYDKMMFTPNYDDEHFFDAFKKPRPCGVRYRDEETLHRIALQSFQAYPVLVQERPRSDMPEGVRGPATNGGSTVPSTGEGSSRRSDPSLETHTKSFSILLFYRNPFDDSTMYIVAYDQIGGPQFLKVVSVVQDPKDIELIDVLWRADIETEKNGAGGAAAASASSGGLSNPALGPSVHPSEQYERDLQLLTEKSIQAPLSREESSRYEDLSKVYFEDFYTSRTFGDFTDRSVRKGGSSVTSSAASSSSCSSSSSASTSSGSTSPSASSSSSSSSSSGLASPSSTTTSTTSGAPANDTKLKRNSITPTDADVESLFEDLGKECGELNMLMPTQGAGIGCPINTMSAPTAYTGPAPTSESLLQNVSLATIAPYNPANLTELDYMVRVGSLPTPTSAQLPSLTVVEPLTVNATNGYPAPNQFWFDSAPDGTASYQSREPVLNMSTLQLPPLALPTAAASSPLDDQTMPPAHHELTTLTGRMTGAGVYEDLNATMSLMTSSVTTGATTATSEAMRVSISNDSSICSASSTSSSPHYSTGSDGENRSPQSRFYGKLAPSASATRGSGLMGGANPSSLSLYSTIGGRGAMEDPEMDDDDDDEEDEDEDVNASSFFGGRRTIGGTPSMMASSSSAVAPRRRGRQSKDEQLAASHGLPVSAAEISDMSLPDLQKLLKSDSLTDQQKQLIRKIRRRGKNKVAARTCRQRRGQTKPTHMSPFESNRILSYSNRH